MVVSLSKNYLYLNDEKKTNKKHGRMSDVIFRRLAEIEAATTLEDLRNAPGRWHELHGNLACHISADLKHPYRLICYPDQPPDTYMDGKSLNWSKVRNVKIISIRDTH